MFSVIGRRMAIEDAEEEGAGNASAVLPNATANATAVGAVMCPDHESCDECLDSRCTWSLVMNQCDWKCPSDEPNSTECLDSLLNSLQECPNSNSTNATAANDDWVNDSQLTAVEQDELCQTKANCTDCIQEVDGGGDGADDPKCVWLTNDKCRSPRFCPTPVTPDGVCQEAVTECEDGIGGGNNTTIILDDGTLNGLNNETLNTTDGLDGNATGAMQDDDEQLNATSVAPTEFGTNDTVDGMDSIVPTVAPIDDGADGASNATSGLAVNETDIIDDGDGLLNITDGSELLNVTDDDDDLLNATNGDDLLNTTDNDEVHNVTSDNATAIIDSEGNVTDIVGDGALLNDTSVAPTEWNSSDIVTNETQTNDTTLEDYLESGVPTIVPMDGDNNDTASATPTMSEYPTLAPVDGDLNETSIAPTGATEINETESGLDGGSNETSIPPTESAYPTVALMDDETSSVPSQAPSTSEVVESAYPTAAPEIGLTIISAAPTQLRVSNSPSVAAINDGGNSELPTITAPASTGPPTVLDTHTATSEHKANEGELPLLGDCSDEANIFVCAYDRQPLIVMGVIAFFPVLCILCCIRRRMQAARNDPRGEYREVAARYGGRGFDNTFSDDYSADGSMELDVEESWSKSGQRVLEMSDMGRNNSDELSMDEMNG